MEQNGMSEWNGNESAEWGKTIKSYGSGAIKENWRLTGITENGSDSVTAWRANALHQQE